MKTQEKKSISLALLAAFTLWTAAVSWIDVQAIGPQGTSVGFAALNSAIHQFTGVHMSLYILTDWLSLIPLTIALGFAFLGLLQWYKRKSLLKVDRSILVLGGFYIVVMAVYLLFELCVINYRPVLINGALEASYPSSTTLLVMSVMPTAAMQFNTRIKSPVTRNFVCCSIIVYMVFMVVARMMSGVHWFSDIVGGVLLSTGLVVMYASFAE